MQLSKCPVCGKTPVRWQHGQGVRVLMCDHCDAGVAYECDLCIGMGQVMVLGPVGGQKPTQNCPKCHGRGWCRLREPSENFNAYGEPQPFVQKIFYSPSQLRYVERLLLYSLVLAYDPEQVLEIGTRYGGTAWVIVQALDELGRGALVCIDPAPAWPDYIEEAISHRAQLVKKSSPAGLKDCLKAANGRYFDFVLIDGDHSKKGVLDDLKGVVKVCQSGAVIVLHDYHFEPVTEAITEAVDRLPLVDCGPLSVGIVPGKEIQGGLYMLRVQNG